MCINVINSDMTMKSYPILDLTLLEKSSSEATVIKFHAKVTNNANGYNTNTSTSLMKSSKDLFKVKSFKFKTSQDIDLFSNMVKNLRQYGLLARQVFDDLTGDTDIRYLTRDRFITILCACGVSDVYAINECFNASFVLYDGHANKGDHKSKKDEAPGVEYSKFFAIFCTNPLSSANDFVISIWNKYLRTTRTMEADRMLYTPSTSTGVVEEKEANNINSSSTIVSAIGNRPSVFLHSIHKSTSSSMLLLTEEPKFLDGESVVQTCETSTLHAIVTLQGFLYLTNYRLYFIAYKNSVLSIEKRLCIAPESMKLFTIVSVPLLTICKIKRDEVENNMFTVLCKDTRSLQLSLDKSTAWNVGFLRVLNSLAFPYSYNNNSSTSSTERQLYVFSAGIANNMSSKRKEKCVNGWEVYNFMNEYTRQGLLANPFWKVYKNDKYGLIPTYPKHFIIPSHITETELAAVIKFRSKGRIPVVTWYNKRTGGVLVRASQPQIGLTSKRCEEDEYLCNLYRMKGNKEDGSLPKPNSPKPNASSASVYAPYMSVSNDIGFYIMDARSQLAAEGNRVRKGGIEKGIYYKNSELVYLNIENIHAMRESVNKFTSTCCEPLNIDDDNNWWEKVGASQWLHHIRLVLKGAVKMAEILELKEESVVCHCSDGWDRTSQLCAITQLILDPYFRTFEGFIVLIEKEWCSFGHKFQQRTGHGYDNATDNERSPIFLQFLDCVYQMMIQFPLAFEFDDSLLLLCIDSLYSCQYGTFLFDCERERAEKLLHLQTCSLWTDVLLNKEIYRNKGYERQDCCIYPIPSLRHMRVWERYYCRYDPDAAVHINRLLFEKDRWVHNSTSNSQLDTAPKTFITVKNPSKSIMDGEEDGVPSMGDSGYLMRQESDSKEKSDVIVKDGDERHSRNIKHASLSYLRRYDTFLYIFEFTMYPL